MGQACGDACFGRDYRHMIYKNFFDDHDIFAVEGLGFQAGFVASVLLLGDNAFIECAAQVAKVPRS